MSELHEIIRNNSCVDGTAKESGCMHGLTEANINDLVEEIIEAVKHKIFNCLRANQFALDSIGKSILIKELGEELDKLKQVKPEKSCPKCKGNKYDSVNGIDGHVVCPQCNGRG